ncbi:hypothetical protein GXM_06238 [Nostoc sphaeroides CCNUC1]|uniref:Uncharacterized protein n=1 Tax=Nostoc sphaeroides CCNUC1 TaxID=2653204 RepID=A0A5P8W7W2_9NOSO|nr:hypothetical protein GXM_06238 [Nostoc sphaeroides CCNUC1]
MTFPPKNTQRILIFSPISLLASELILFLSEIQYIKTNWKNEHLFTKLYS